MKELIKEFADNGLVSEALISHVSLPKVDSSYPQNQTMPGAQQPTPAAPPQQGTQPTTPATQGTAQSSTPKPVGDPASEVPQETDKQDPNEEPEEKEKTEEDKDSVSFLDSLDMMKTNFEGLKDSLDAFKGKIESEELKAEFESILDKYGMMIVQDPGEEDTPTENEPEDESEEKPEENPELEGEEESGKS